MQMWRSWESDREWSACEKACKKNTNLGCLRNWGEFSSVALLQGRCVLGRREEAWGVMRPERHYDGTSSNVGVPVWSQSQWMNIERSWVVESEWQDQMRIWTKHTLAKKWRKGYRDRREILSSIRSPLQFPLPEKLFLPQLQNSFPPLSALR